MFVIRRQQLEALRRGVYEGFVRRTIAHLRARFPEAAAMPPAELRRFVLDGSTAAETYDLAGEDDVRAFLEYRMIYGERFPEAPGLEWAREVLTDRGLHTHDKVLQLDARHALIELDREDNGVVS